MLPSIIRMFSLVPALSSCVVLLTLHLHSEQMRPLDPSTQIVVVTSSDWNAIQGTLQRFERGTPRAKWKPVGARVPVVLGKNGLGWGMGVVNVDSLRAPGDPVKKEGDGRAPAGVFVLSKTFGYAPQARQGWKMPYVPLTSSVECVDDSGSKFYNRVVDRGSVSPDWNSSEHMLRQDELYRWGVLVEHNSNPPHAGAGSCIFMHIWRGPDQPTVGCTAMPQAQLEPLISWLDPARHPLLVQLPAPEYRKLKRKWKLPKLPRLK